MTREEIQKEIKKLEEKRFLISMKDRFFFDDKVLYDDLGWRIFDLQRLLDED